MKNILLHIFLICSMQLVFDSLLAQNITLNTQLDTNQMLIGDQINLNIRLSCPKDIKIKFPELKDTLSTKIEILSKSKIDTTFNNDIINYKQKLLITVFDSGKYIIPSIPFIVSNQITTDTINSREQFLFVNTIQVDSAMQKIMDIKEPYKAPITFKEVLPYILYSTGIILILLLTYLIISRRKKHIPIFQIKEKPKEPAHIIALRELEKIKKDKLWQNNKVKAHHSQISETIRRYLENRFQIKALEQSTDEILSALQNTKSLEEKNYKLLQETLQLSDLVKFAKVQPLPDENDLILNKSFQFVNETKLEVIKEIEQEKNKKQINTEQDV